MVQCPKIRRKEVTELVNNRAAIGKTRRYTLGEEIFNSISHGVGGLLGIAGTAVLIVMAVLHSDALGIVACSVYGGSLIVLYTMSTLYHAITNRHAKRFFRIMDHDTIFLLIAGTYTPITLIPLRGALGWMLFGVVWCAALIGIILNSVNLERFRRVSIVCYVATGWVIILAVKPMIESCTTLTLWLLLIGGLFYTVGIIFYVMKSKRYFHSIWHLFTVAGSVFHYFSIMLMTLNN